MPGIPKSWIFFEALNPDHFKVSLVQHSRLSLIWRDSEIICLHGTNVSFLIFKVFFCVYQDYLSRINIIDTAGLFQLLFFVVSQFLPFEDDGKRAIRKVNR